MLYAGRASNVFWQVGAQPKAGGHRLLPVVPSSLVLRSGFSVPMQTPFEMAGHQHPGCALSSVQQYVLTTAMLSTHLWGPSSWLRQRAQAFSLVAQQATAADTQLTYIEVRPWMQSCTPSTSCQCLRLGMLSPLELRIALRMTFVCNLILTR